MRADGYPVNFGTSFIMTVDYSAGPVQAWSLLTYGETGDRGSPLFESQTVRFSTKDWRTVAFTAEQIEPTPTSANRRLRATDGCGRPTAQASVPGDWGSARDSARIGRTRWRL